MSGIPIYTTSPIHASRPSGTSSQTATPDTHLTPLAPKTALATTTATPSQSSYPSARPGAVAPTPTAAAQRYAPLQPVQPTPTTKTGHEGPPPPQPGPVSLLSTAGTLPPPPKGGETYHTPAQAPLLQPYPPQMSIPAPNSAFGAQPPTSATRTSTTASSAYPAPLPGEYGTPRRSLEHPPGYQQDSYASELSSEQRRAQDVTNNSSGGFGGLGGYGGSQTANGTGIGAESLWSTAKGWATAAGNKISETEQEVWRRINKE